MLSCCSTQVQKHRIHVSLLELLEWGCSLSQTYPNRTNRSYQTLRANEHDIASEATQELLDMVKNWEKAFNLYENKDFQAALNIFQAIYSNNNVLRGGTDFTAKKYLDRCTKYLSSPPDEKAWDGGVDNLTSK